MSTILEFLFNKYTLSIVVFLGVVLAIGGLSGRLLWNKYVIGALVLLALGWGAYGWAFNEGESHQLAKDQPKIEKLEKQIKDMQAKRDAEIAKLKADADKATLENKAKELAWNTAATKAKNEANQRTRVLQENAATAAIESSGLRNDITAARSALRSASADAVRKYNDAASVVLNQCVGKYQSLAQDIDRCTSERQTLIDAWPTK